MPQISAHDWFRPKLIALLAEATQAGYPRDVAEAVITDLMNGALSASATPPDENWAHDAGEPAEASSEMPPHLSVDSDRFDGGELLEQNKIPLRRIY